MILIRVKDKHTGHEFDVPETDWRIPAGFFVPVKPKLFPPTDVHRRPKHNKSIFRPARTNKEEAE